MSKENKNKFNENTENYTEIIEKQINFLKNKLNVFDEIEYLSENNFKSYLNCKEKITDNRELTKIYLDEQ